MDDSTLVGIRDSLTADPSALLHLPLFRTNSSERLIDGLVDFLVTQSSRFRTGTNGCKIVIEFLEPWIDDGCCTTFDTLQVDFVVNDLHDQEIFGLSTNGFSELYRDCQLAIVKMADHRGGCRFFTLHAIFHLPFPPLDNHTANVARRLFYKPE